MTAGSRAMPPISPLSTPRATAERGRRRFEGVSHPLPRGMGGGGSGAAGRSRGWRSRPGKPASTSRGKQGPGSRRTFPHRPRRSVSRPKWSGLRRSGSRLLRSFTPAGATAFRNCGWRPRRRPGRSSRPRGKSRRSARKSRSTIRPPPPRCWPAKRWCGSLERSRPASAPSRSSMARRGLRPASVSTIWKRRIRRLKALSATSITEAISPRARKCSMPSGRRNDPTLARLTGIIRFDDVMRELAVTSRPTAADLPGAAGGERRSSRARRRRQLVVRRGQTEHRKAGTGHQGEVWNRRRLRNSTPSGNASWPAAPGPTG